MNNSENAAYQLGQAKGQTEEKGSHLMDQASKTTQSAAETAKQAGSVVMEKAQGATDAVKNTVGAKK